MLKVENVSKSFKKRLVLQDINLTVDAGELVHISGINGSGKSTLFKIIAKLLAPDQGKVTLGSDDYLGALIENPGFLEYESGLSNLAFLAKLNQHYDEGKIRQLMQRFSLDPDDPQAIKNYSIGMRQKVGIIQAVMEDQTIILLDEPTRGIDQEGIGQFTELCHELTSSGKSIVVASHDTIAEMKYDRQLHLENGVLHE
ncbi:ABC transporter ATP-binding protein [Lactobacillus corticis]|uniref:ABC transporter ATP-binding protein n=1 Tax=Lactobacillus corticis TaxID=2201249 RepID=A0A916QHT0_9LACO|nr:ABC transporter ATP-binding protein [Lactobacillus corticis]GFZ26513.1 ABC transporter ATP-binding protein [Lactobacillus corticis]